MPKKHPLSLQHQGIKVFGWLEKLLWKLMPKELVAAAGVPKCRNCGSINIFEYQDGGHDWAECCRDCWARYGVQGPPFDIVERISDAPPEWRQRDTQV